MGLKKTPRFILLSIGYAAIIQVSYLAALLLRFEGDVPARPSVVPIVLARYSTPMSMIAKGFFTSWATPAANRPAESNRSAWTS